MIPEPHQEYHHNANGISADGTTATHPLRDALTAHELWDTLVPIDKLKVILTHYTDPEPWLALDVLEVLAQYRQLPPGLWGQIRLRYKAIGGNAYDLQQAVDQLRTLHELPVTPAGTSPALETMSALELDALHIPPITFVVDDILPIGCTVFVGRAKDGKSLAMWNMCVAVAEGGVVFGKYSARKGTALYMALEDGERRGQQRLHDQMQAAGMVAPPANLHFRFYEAPRLGEGLEAQLTAWLEAHWDTQLVVIDILEKVRPRRHTRGSVYEDDYMALASLQRLAQERSLAIVVVHHVNKTKTDDFRDTISGSTSLGGAADTIWVLRRLAGERDAALKITGRDVDTLDIALQFEEGLWTAVGDVTAYRMSQASRDVMDTLQQSTTPLTPKQLATVLGVAEGVMRMRCIRMVDRGEIITDGHGHYRVGMGAPHEAQACVTPVAPVTPVMGVTPVTLSCAHNAMATSSNSVPSARDDGEVTGTTPATPVTRVTGVTPQSANDSPPVFCPGCGAQTCWLDRETSFQCAHKHCGYQWLPQVKGGDASWQDGDSDTSS